MAEKKETSKKESAVKKPAEVKTVVNPVKKDKEVKAASPVKAVKASVKPDNSAAVNSAVKAEPAKKGAASSEVKKTEPKTAVKTHGMVRVTMIHGLGSCSKRQIRTAKALRLSRPGDVRELPDLPSTLGACKKLEHIVKVEKI
jgi:ribosomal protein L30/L7E